ncbi:hypothetical protein [Streptacidiphilus sp. MAP5-52]|uniref:hypothetical protein n=1 Tax=Streptacidiphilus sp. MAP5-52 TaxID=3156267 RepID=UPI0035117678
MIAESSTKLAHRMPDFERRTISTGSARYPDGSPTPGLGDIPLGPHAAPHLRSRLRGMRGEM